MLKLGSDQRRKWLYLCGSHRIYWHLWEFSSVSNQILTLRWIQTKNSKNISWSFPSWHRPPVRLSSSGHFTYLFFFAYFSRVIRWSEHFQQSFPKKNKTNIYSFYIKSAQKTKNKNQTFTLSARIWTQRCDSDFAQGCKISLESLDGVHVSLTVWPSPTQRPVDALIINCIAKNNPTTRLSSSGGGWSLLGNMHTQSESLPPPPPPITHYCCFAQCAKTKRGANHDGRTEEELQQKHRTPSDASGGFQKSTFVHFHLCRWRAERDDTIVWARGPIRWLLFL